MSSYASDIRDQVFDIVLGMGLANTMRVVPTFQWQPEQAPAIGVYLRRERMAAQGDANAGEPSFLHSVTIGISILTRAKDAMGLVAVTDDPANRILEELLTNTDLLAEIEAVTDVEQTPNFAPNGSSYLTEVRLELTVTFRSDWPPDVRDGYKRTTIETRQRGSDPDAPSLTTTIDLAQD